MVPIIEHLLSPAAKDASHHFPVPPENLLGIYFWHLENPLRVGEAGERESMLSNFWTIFSQHLKGFTAGRIFSGRKVWILRGASFAWVAYRSILDSNHLSILENGWLDAIRCALQMSRQPSVFEIDDVVAIRDGMPLCGAKGILHTPLYGFWVRGVDWKCCYSINMQSARWVAPARSLGWSDYCNDV